MAFENHQQQTHNPRGALYTRGYVESVLTVCMLCGVFCPDRNGGARALWHNSVLHGRIDSDRRSVRIVLYWLLLLLPLLVALVLVMACVGGPLPCFLCLRIHMLCTRMCVVVCMYVFAFVYAMSARSYFTFLGVLLLTVVTAQSLGLFMACAIMDIFLANAVNSIVILFFMLLGA